MPELTAQELNALVSKHLGLYIEYMPHQEYPLWVLRDANGEQHVSLAALLDKNKSKAEEEVWGALAPEFSGSLDACKPLIEEINKAGHAVDYRISEESVCVQLYTGLGEPLVDGYAEIKESADIIACTATALCRAFLKFKELTKEETNGQGV